MQRDLLPLIEGCTVATKHGSVSTDHVLFICSGAFHAAKPSDMLAELQVRWGGVCFAVLLRIVAHCGANQPPLAPWPLAPHLTQRPCSATLLLALPLPPPPPPPP